MMHKKFRTLISAAAIAVALSPVSAKAFMLDWKLGFDGTGLATAVTINEFLDVVGPSIITTSVPAGGTFSFNEHGAVNVAGHDGGVPFAGSTQIAAILNITGTATLGGAINYTSGTIDVFFNPTKTFATGGNGTYGVDPAGSILIGTFSPVSGQGVIDTAGIPNGQQTISAEATMLKAGFWFDSTGTDLSTLLDTHPTFGFATTNASWVRFAPALVVNELGGGSVTNCLPGQTTGGCTGAGNFEISNNGQFRLNAIPEPGSLSLIGLAMISLGLIRRRRNMC